MQDILFSIIIPTCDRLATLRYSLLTALRQKGDDIEIIVADNSGPPELKEYVSNLDDKRIVYIRSDERISMTSNWVNAIEAASGRYLTIFGDDDGIPVHSTSLARSVFSQHDLPLLTWSPDNYNWPNVIIPKWANFLSVRHTSKDKVEKIKSPDILDLYFKTRNLNVLPSIYNSYVSMGVLEKTRMRWGSYFPFDHCPDVCSGLFNLIVEEMIFRINTPLSVRGISGSSGGCSALFPKYGKQVCTKVVQNEGLEYDQKSNTSLPVHHELLTSDGLGSELFPALMESFHLQFRDLVPGSRIFDFNPLSYISRVASFLNRDPDNYDVNFKYVLGFCERYGISVDKNKIPTKNVSGDEAWGLVPGVKVVNEVDTLISIKSDLVGIQTIDDACRFVESLYSPSRFISGS